VADVLGRVLGVVSCLAKLSGSPTGRLRFLMMGNADAVFSRCDCRMWDSFRLCHRVVYGDGCCEGVLGDWLFEPRIREHAFME